MAAEGVHLLRDVSQLAAIGPWEALSYLGNYWRLFQRILSESRQRRPKLAILVDFPEFNLRLARRLKAAEIPVCYFISPQVWAWRSSRVDLIRQYVDLMLVIFPFEEDFYRQRGIQAHYVGNPTLKTLRALRRANSASSSPPTVALLPGSRKNEVERILPIQLDAASFIAQRCGARFWIAKAPSIHGDCLAAGYRHWLGRGHPPLDLEIRPEGATALLPEVDCAIIKSGTSTLEAMILGVPFAMVYRMSSPSWYVARPLVKTDTYCLANLIAGKRVVPEFVQKEATGENIGSYLLGLLQDGKKCNQVKLELQAAVQKLGDHDAYAEGARLIAEKFRI